MIDASKTSATTAFRNAPVKEDIFILSFPYFVMFLEVASPTKTLRENSCLFMAAHDRSGGGVKTKKIDNRNQVKSPFPMSTLRNPNRRMTGVVTVFILRLPAKTESTSRPDVDASRPKPI
jgi:hypothetical protein